MKTPRYRLLGLIAALLAAAVIGALIAYDRNNTIVSPEVRDREFALSLPTVSGIEFHRNDQVEVHFHLGASPAQREIDILKIAERLLKRREKVVFYAPEMATPKIFELNKEDIKRLN